MTTLPASPAVGTARGSIGWVDDAVVYRVYPRSFADANGDGIGDLRGIRSRIPYLADLGVDALLIGPFYRTAFADGGVDVIDPRAVDPVFGSLDDFDDLVEAAHAEDLRVAIELVPAQTSDRHPWFEDALEAGPRSPARERYIFRPGRGSQRELPPNDWQSRYGASAWTRVPDGEWYLHLLSPEQPDLNWDHPDVRSDFEETVRFWVERGIDGLQASASTELARGSLVPHNSTASRDVDGSACTIARDRTNPLVSAPAKPDAAARSTAILSESWAPTRWRLEEFRLTIDATLAQPSDSVIPTWLLEDENVVRAPSRFGLAAGADLDAWLLADLKKPLLDRVAGLRRARAAMMLVLGLPGAAQLYQGQELGLFQVTDLTDDELRDPIWEQSGRTRRGRDGARVPIPWTTSGPSLGFGSVDPWLPQPAEFARYAIAEQSHSGDSVLDFYWSALHLRRVLNRGDQLRWLSQPHDEVLAFERHPGWHSVTNFGAAPVPLPNGTVLLSSGPLSSDVLPRETTVWVRPEQ